MSESPSSQRCLIVGASHAGAQLAASLRQAGWSGPVTLLSADPHLPYHRPPLSKAFLCGEKSREEILLRPQSAWDKLEVELRPGARVNAIDRQARTLLLENGESLAWNRLALTTGARVRKIAVPGSELPGVLYLRDMEDALRLQAMLAAAKRAVVIGGGYIGLETAASLRKAGIDVCVLEALPRVLARVTAPEVSAFYTRVHGEEGVHIRTDVVVEAIEGKQRVEAVRLAGGETVAADIVVVGIGVIAETELAQQAGLEVDNGIVVDEFARSSDPAIVAAGDCTNHYSPLYGRRMRLESVQNATDQAKVAANTLCGRLEAYNALPWFWSDQYDLKLQIAGLSQGYDQVVIRGSTESGRSFAAFYLRGGQLIAIDAVNRPKEFMLGKRALTATLHPDVTALQDESRNIQDILVPAAQA